MQLAVVICGQPFVLFEDPRIVLMRGERTLDVTLVAVIRMFTRGRLLIATVLKIIDKPSTVLRVRTDQEWDMRHCEGFHTLVDQGSWPASESAFELVSAHKPLTKDHSLILEMASDC